MPIAIPFSLDDKATRAFYVNECLEICGSIFALHGLQMNSDTMFNQVVTQILSEYETR